MPTDESPRAFIARRGAFLLPARCLLFALVLVVWCASNPASAAIAYIQGSGEHGYGTTTDVATTYDDPQSAGGLNVVIVGWAHATATVSSVTDTQGNTYVLAVGPTRTTSPDLSQSIYYAKNIVSASAGTNTVTVTFSTTVLDPTIRAVEYSGIDTASPFDTANGATGNSTLASTSSITTSQADEVLVAGNYIATDSTGPGTNFTERVLTDGAMLEDRIVSSTGSYSATIPQSPSGKWIIQVAAFKASAGGGDTQAPTVPTLQSATPVSSTQINLSWTASSDNVAVTGYRVERCQGASCSNFVEIGTPTGTTFNNNTGLSPSTTYRYRVRAHDAVPNFSGYSSILNATTQAAGDTQAPTDPTLQSATPVSSTQINLSWTASSDNVAVTGYRVERCQGASCSNFVEVGTPAGTTFNNSSGLVASTTYRYRVRAQDAVPNFSNYSNILNATTQAPGDTQAPTAPSGLLVVASSSTEIDLVWTGSTDNVAVTAYLVERCQGAGCSNFSQVSSSAATKFDDTGRAASTTYRYRVRAQDAVPNFSTYSNIIQIATPASSPDCD